ncbi:hypothetical protein [Microbispora sp. KK1-11]|uniref:hypothetical protein n=1 Tax=Microbispora sp. KK1-11 TaxID=2053005 RepID=UPI00163BBA46|nr:hypothetical protein [Microbispora sp. KK1-11]
MLTCRRDSSGNRRTAASTRRPPGAADNALDSPSSRTFDMFTRPSPKPAYRTVPIWTATPSR